MLNLEDYYEDIPIAQQYASQKDFEQAINIYQEILDKVNPDDETVPYLYLNYSNFLFKNAVQYFMDEIKNIHTGFNLEERKIYEADLEDAWTFLEICRSSFVILKDDLSLAKTYFLLGEISLFNNNFRDAIRDFIECENIYIKNNIDKTEFIELYLSMSSAYEFLDDFEMSLSFLNKIVEISKDCNLEHFDVLEKIEEIKLKNGKPKVVVKDIEDLSEMKDINTNKKRIN